MSAMTEMTVQNQAINRKNHNIDQKTSSIGIAPSSALVYNGVQ
jgi:hypothetical protein